MSNNKVCCEEVKVEENLDLNDRDYLNDLLYNEKSILNNTITALLEASNESIREEFLDFFNIIDKIQATTYELAWNNGWYTLEQAEKTKINQKAKELQKKLDELSK